VASLQGGLVGIATALSPAMVRPFQVFTTSFFCRIKVNNSFQIRLALANKTYPAIFNQELFGAPGVSIGLISVDAEAIFQLSGNRDGLHQAFS
jgi:hypothetical protein